MVVCPEEQAGQDGAGRHSYADRLVMELLGAHVRRRGIAECLYRRNGKVACYDSDFERK